MRACRFWAPPPEAIDLAEDRGEFSRVLEEGGLISPKNGTAFTFEGAKRIADEIGYRFWFVPRYVLGWPWHGDRLR